VSSGTDSRFDYQDVYLAELRRTMSDERFLAYLAANHDNERLACQRYAWNTAVSSAFYGPIQALEVSLRNAVDERLRPAKTAQWYMSTVLLKRDEQRVVQDTLATINRLGKTTSPGQVIANLPFRFWVQLFAKDYDESLWRPYLHKIFARTKRSYVHDGLDRLRTLRNRIAHHEPIYQRNLGQDLNTLRRLLEPLSPQVLQWVRHHDRVQRTMSVGPGDLTYF
jgi:Swt1-like HEPN